MPGLAAWLVLALVLCGVSVFAAAWSYLPVIWGAPWVPSSSRTIQRRLSLAALRPGQTLIDLGAGDGRIVVAAAKTFGARAVGVEIDPLRCAIANGLISLAGLRGKARVVSHSFSMEGWTPVAIDEKNRQFVYEIGRTGENVETRFV